MLINSRLFVLLLIIPYVLLSCASTSSARFAVENLHPAPSRILISEKSGITTFEVESEFGIGRSKIILLSGKWPSRSKVRLHLKGLEGITILTADKSFQTGELAIEKSELNGNLYFDVKLPEEISALTKEIQVHWVDFYR